MAFFFLLDGIRDLVRSRGLGDVYKRQGYWTVDFGILLAGPIAKILTIIAKTFDVKYELGIEEAVSYTHLTLPTKRIV